MKRMFGPTATAAILALALPLTALAAQREPGEVDFGDLTPSKSGGEFVEVHIKADLIAMVARLAEKAEPEMGELLRGLKQVRVNVIGLDEGNREEVQDRVKSIREKLARGGWERIVTAQKDKEDVGVYVKTKGSEVFEGVVVTVLSGDSEAVLVNIVGNISPDQIATVGERLNIEPLKKAGAAVPKS